MDADRAAGRKNVGGLTAVGLIVAGTVVAFAFMGGWLTPHTLTPGGIVNTLEATGGMHTGFRRNHAKGVAISGYFESNGAGEKWSKAGVFKAGRVEVIGRFALAGGQPYQADNLHTVRSMALLFKLADGEEWRTGMNNIPVFPVHTPEEFNELLIATAPDPATGQPNAEKAGAFFGSHPEAAKAIGMIKGQTPSSGFDDAAYNALDAFYFVDADGKKTPVRWSMVPVQPFVAGDDKQPASKDENILFDDLIATLGKGHLQWKLMVTIGEPGDPTNDAAMVWPAGRETVEVGKLTIDAVQGEGDGSNVARDINFDPLVLPAGIEGSDDPLLSARSAAYAESFKRREGEKKEPSAVQTGGAK